MPSGNTHHVLDGGSLLFHLPWTRGSTYEAIFNLGVQYVLHRYNKATVVFDGYEDGPSTKDCIHVRHGGIGYQTIDFQCHMVMTSKKQEFLASKANKQRFINIFSNKLQAAGCTVLHATGDADLLIAMTAVESSRAKATALIGEDTDLLVLLSYHADLNSPHNLFFVPKTTSSSTKV